MDISSLSELESSEMFALDGRPYLQQVKVTTTDVTAYGALLTEEIR